MSYRRPSELSLDELEAKIGAYHDKIAAFMHERNEKPGDEQIRLHLDELWDELRVYERARADKILGEWAPLVSEEDKAVLERGRAIVRKYEREKNIPELVGQLVRKLPGCHTMGCWERIGACGVFCDYCADEMHESSRRELPYAKELRALLYATDPYESGWVRPPKGGTP